MFLLCYWSNWNNQTCLERALSVSVSFSFIAFHHLKGNHVMCLMQIKMAALQIFSFRYHFSTIWLGCLLFRSGVGFSWSLSCVEKWTYKLKSSNFLQAQLYGVDFDGLISLWLDLIVVVLPSQVEIKPIVVPILLILVASWILQI